MTNGEKYLKEGVKIDDFINDIFTRKYVEEFDRQVYISIFRMEYFLREEAKPTLTEDERVILRNIQKGLFREGFISRTAGNELFVFIKETGETIELYIFNHLFQFIKERRRI